MMLDQDIVAVSPSSVYRVLSTAGLLRRWNGKQSKKGTGFVQPLRPHEHWHIDISCINIRGTFYYLCCLLDGCSRYIVHWELREAMTEADVEIILQRAREVCAQCHVTYTMPKNAQMKTTDVLFPWSGSQWGNISVENIIATIKSDPTYKEWTQSVTGFKLGFVRHPEFEFFSKDSPHWQAGLSCAYCHMPSTDAADQTISDHRIMSPLKNDLTACADCHTEEPNSLREMVLAIQDNTATVMINTGYALAGVAKLFELAHHSSAAETITTTSLYQQAKEAYEQAFYRLMFIQNENSTGFHNPPEATRILNDTQKYTNTAERLLREAIITSGITIPEIVDLELDQYLYNRGDKKLNFNPDMEIVLPQTPHYPDSMSEEPHQITTLHCHSKKLRRLIWRGIPTSLGIPHELTRLG